MDNITKYAPSWKKIINLCFSTKRMARRGSLPPASYARAQRPDKPSRFILEPAPLLFPATKSQLTQQIFFSYGETTCETLNKFGKFLQYEILALQFQILQSVLSFHLYNSKPLPNLDTSVHFLKSFARLYNKKKVYSLSRLGNYDF